MPDNVFKNIMRIATNKYGLRLKKDVAEKIGATPQKLTNWKTRGIPPAEYVNIAKRLNVSIDEIINSQPFVAEYRPIYQTSVSPAPELSQKQVPIISWVQAGIAAEAIDLFQPGDADDWVTPSRSVKAHTYALRVVGDSMSPMFNAGMILVVEPEMYADPGDYVIAKNGDEEATFKQLVKDGGNFYLKPLNPQYPTIQIGSYHIIGVVRDAIIRLK